jgi:hypothetical protein
MSRQSSRADDTREVVAARRSRRLVRRGGPLAAALLLSAAAAWTVVTAGLIQQPHLDQVVRSDAIVVLGEPDAGAMRRAHALLQQGVSAELVLIIPYGPPPDCADPPTGVTVSCVVPDPSTTRGDARAIGRLAQEHHWARIVVITWPTHISRSRALIQRCYPGELIMTDYQLSLPTRTARLQEQLYQSGAYLKATLARDC